MKSSVRLSVVCASAAVARSLESVLAPDNASAPAGVSFSASRRGRALAFAATSGRPRSAVTTMQSVVTDVALFREIWLISPGRHRRGRGS